MENHFNSHYILVKRISKMLDKGKYVLGVFLTLKRLLTQCPEYRNVSLISRWLSPSYSSKYVDTKTTPPSSSHLQNNNNYLTYSNWTRVFADSNERLSLNLVSDQPICNNVFLCIQLLQLYANNNVSCYDFPWQALLPASNHYSYYSVFFYNS